MPYNPEVHHRQSIRLRDYDYSRAGAYFVTICAWQRECLFGEVVDGGIVLTPNGRIVLDVWGNLFHHYPHVELDQFVVMPNHVHGIIVLNDDIRTDVVGAVSGRSGCDVNVRAGLKPAPTVRPIKRHGV